MGYVVKSVARQRSVPAGLFFGKHEFSSNKKRVIFLDF